MGNFYFRRIADNRFEPSRHTEGAWSREDYHFSALAGLMVNEIERSRPNAELVLSRVSFDILGRLPFEKVAVDVEVLRPGRTIELVQATASIGGRAMISARAWYLAAADTAEVAHMDEHRLPAPDECPEGTLQGLWGGGFIEQMHFRKAGPIEPGHGAIWLTSDNQLIEGEPRIEVAEFFARIDVANGVSPRRQPTEWAFPNVDLTVHLYRQPDGAWTGLDTKVYWGAEGIGLTSSVLHDVHGPVGRAEQILTLRKI